MAEESAAATSTSVMDVPPPSLEASALEGSSNLSGGGGMGASNSGLLSPPMGSGNVTLDIPANMQLLNKSNVKINFKRSLGKGGFAEVFEVELPDGKLAAIKVMDKSAVSRSTFVSLQSELSICASLSHPTIINTLGIFEDDVSIYIVMDLAGGGELFKYMKKFGLEDMHLVAPNFVGEVVLGLEYMAQCGVVHRDIKPENLLLTAEYHVKIADFGTVCRMDDENQKFTGTAQYVSPEVIATGRASNVSDLWALGCVLFQLFVGRPPFQGDSQYAVLQNIKNRSFEFPPYFPADARDLVDRMLELDPTKRIGAKGFDEVKRHAFFKSVDWGSILTKSNVTHLNADYDKKWEAFLLKNEHVVYSSRIVKERYKGMSVGTKERILILTDFPRMFYLDPGDLSIKGQVPWTDALCAEANGQSEFEVHTPDRVYHFIDKENRAALWAAKINDLVKSKKAPLTEQRRTHKK